jgi:hypothetical protein
MEWLIESGWMGYPLPVPPNCPYEFLSAWGGFLHESRSLVEQEGACNVASLAAI